MSILVGELDFQTAFLNVVGREPSPEEVAVQGIRTAMVGDIRKAGLAVVHTPARKIANSRHSSLVWPAEPNVEPATPWPDEIISALELCFSKKEEKVKP